MPNVLIVEDDALSFEVLKDQLQEQLSGWTISGPAISIREAVKTIREQAPDLVFLDIGLKDGSGFEVLKQLGPIGFDVVVTTGNDQHALEAIKHSALDYLVKPIIAGELTQALQKVDRLRKERLAARQPSFTVLLNKLAVPTADGLLFIKVNEIIRLESDKNYTDFYLEGNRKIVVTRNLKEYEEQLTPYGFFRVHHSHMVNLNHLVRYVKGEGGYVVMTDGSSVDVSRRKKEEFLARLAG